MADPNAARSDRSSEPALPALSPNPLLWESLGGATLVEFSEADQRVGIRFECLEQFCHSGGRIAQGGFVTAWMDAAMAHAVMLSSGNRLNVASLDINVRFLRAAGPGTVIARGWVVRMGRRVAFLEGALEDADGRQLATATSSGMLVPLQTE